MYIQVNGASYAFTMNGKGKPLILLHGFTGSKHTWDDFIKRWQTSFQVIALDLPGHGQTTTNNPRTMEMVVDDLREILRQLKIEKAHIVGYSMGGRTALAYALTYPETILSLTLESASPGLTSQKERRERRKNDEQLIKRLKNDGLKSFVNFWENIPLFVTQKRLAKDIQEKIRQERLKQSQTGLIASLRYMGTGQQPSLWNDLQSLNAHVLLIVGEHDKKFVKLNEQMQKRLPNVKLKVIERAGHAVHIEQPDLFYDEVTYFVQSIH
ncbi:MAG TPA: 2-succinyl-6-hydroxy-2,4-cyclohexadiene-1-carboxylate synthase [Bacillota bacterium]|nr:2-succinyl-6-hydroxy-2,4-cyclohexadiene-1-carboxylate synthase [Bacillota bacterium]